MSKDVPALGADLFWTVREKTITVRRIRSREALALAAFYNGLSQESKRTFRPLGESTSVDVCQRIVEDNATDVRFDLLALCEDEIVGWGFLWDLPSGKPTLGLCVADAWQGRGIGSRLILQLMQAARDLGLCSVGLTVVQDNEVALRLYRRTGFELCVEFVGQDGLPYYRMEADLTLSSSRASISRLTSSKRPST